ncbi:MAG: hypothetical protein ACOVOW_08525 [Spirosomataceae bacterium]
MHSPLTPKGEILDDGQYSSLRIKHYTLYTNHYFNETTDYC